MEDTLIAKLVRAITSLFSRPAEIGEEPALPLGQSAPPPVFEEEEREDEGRAFFIEPEDPIETDPLYMGAFFDFFFNAWDDDPIWPEDPFGKWG